MVPSSAGKNGRRCAVTNPPVGHVKPTLGTLAERVRPLDESSSSAAFRKSEKCWDARMNKKAAITCSAVVLHPQSVVRMVSDKADNDAIFLFC